MELAMNPERRGGRERALGIVRYGADLGHPGDLFLACLRADKAPAAIEFIDDREALKVPGVVRVFTARDIPGVNKLGIIPMTQDQEFLAEGTVRCPGQAIACLAALSREAALAGVRALRVGLKPLPGVFDPEDALVEGAPLVHPGREGGNLLVARELHKGDAEAALREAAVVVGADYSTSFVEHAALETEGGRAEWRDGRVVIWASTQNPHYDQADVARFLGVEKDKVRVVQAETGGGFGGKLDLSVQPYLALAAWHLKRPVRMTYTREETFAATAKRHPFQMRYESGADERGRLTALKADLLVDTGAFASYGLAVALRALVHAAGPYCVPNVSVRVRLAYTNHPWAGAMRGFGVPQVALAHEGQMDALAAQLGLDPLEMRLINALRAGQSTITGQVLKDGVGLVACLERIRPIYAAWRRRAEKRRAQGGRYLPGVGLGSMYYGIGNTGVPNPSTAQLAWGPEGRLTLFTGAADIGQGSDTALLLLAAKRLGVDPASIDLCRGDTDRTTNAGATSASRQTYISGNAVLAAAADLERQLKAAAADLLGLPAADLELIGGGLRSKAQPGRALAVEEAVRHIQAQGGQAKGRGEFDPVIKPLDHHTGQGEPYEAYAFAAQTVCAAVDSASGMVRVERVAAAHDVGRAVNRRAVLGQICGGVMMGVGMALMEEYEPGKSQNLQSYHIPTAADAPRIVPLIVEEPVSSGPYGAKGVGEPALIPTAPAVAAAVGQAVGRPLRSLPISLERVVEALTGQEKG